MPQRSRERSAAPSAGALHTSLLERLIEVLRIERRLVDRLSRLLVRQRSAIFASAADEIIECTYATRRVLLTLEEARKQRRTYAAQLVGALDLTVPELMERLSPLGSTALTSALLDISVSAQALRAEIFTQRTVLERVVGDADAVASRGAACLAR